MEAVAAHHPLVTGDTGLPTVSAVGIAIEPTGTYLRICLPTVLQCSHTYYSPICAHLVAIHWAIVYSPWRVFTIWCSEMYGIYLTFSRKLCSICIRTDTLALEVTQTFLSLLHAWSLDSDLDRFCLKKLGLERFCPHFLIFSWKTLLNNILNHLKIETVVMLLYVSVLD